MDKIITFIVLAYNVEDYLCKCLDSFLCPSVMKKMEVIVIDDGSVDCTGAIADTYVKQYPETFRVIHKDNGGHGAGINIGSMAARGRYFKAVDADDWVITEHLPEFIDQLEKCDADVVLTPFHTVDMVTGKKTEKHTASERSESITLASILNHWCDYEDICVFHGITYRTQFYQTVAHKLPEHVFYEDQAFNAIPFCSADKIAVFNVYIYQYLIGNAQQSVSFINQARRIRHVEQVAQDIIAYYKSGLSLSETAKDYLRIKIKGICLIYFATALIYEQDKMKGRALGKNFGRMMKKDMLEIWREIRNKYIMYLFMNYMHISPESYQKLVESNKYRRFKNTIREVIGGK